MFFAETIPVRLALVLAPSASAHTCSGCQAAPRGRTPQLTHLWSGHTGAASGAPRGKPGPSSCCCSQTFPLLAVTVLQRVLVLPARPAGPAAPLPAYKGVAGATGIHARAGSTVISGFPHGKFHYAQFVLSTPSWCFKRR